jgi:hypothetical protein
MTVIALGRSWRSRLARKCARMLAGLKAVGDVREWSGLTMCVAFALGVALGCGSEPSVGTMPPPGADGTYTSDEVPDFVAVAGRDGGIVGYVSSREALGDVNDGPIPVLDRDLRTLVGHLVPDIGFVPLGTDPHSLPTLAASAAAESPTNRSDGDIVSLYVRNAEVELQWVATVVADGIGTAQGYHQGLGAGCLTMAVGDRIVLMTGSPSQTDARPIRTLYEQGAGAAPELWIDIDSTGQVDTGRGVPAWWPGGGVCG